jgi:hypothetical protein
VRSIRVAIVLGLIGLLAGAASSDHHEGDDHKHTSQPDVDLGDLPRYTAPEGAAVYIVSPKDGDTVSSPITVIFGLRGMGVAPAGVDMPNTGHHHLIIDTQPPNPNAPIPNDHHHLHFGGGQTETAIELRPGNHVLQLVLGDLNHVPHTKPIMSPRIVVRVK